MKKLAYDLKMRITAFVLLVVFAAAFALSAAGVVFLVSNNAYTDGGQEAAELIMKELLLEKMQDASDYYGMTLRQEGDLRQYAQEFSADNTNFFFTITDESGTEVMSNYEANNYKYSYSGKYSVRASSEEQSVERSFSTEDEMYDFVQSMEERYSDISYTDTHVVDNDGKEAFNIRLTYVETEYKNITVNGYIRSVMTAKDVIFQSLSWLSWLIGARVWLAVVCAVTGVCGIFMFCFLIYGAGHRKDEEGIVLGPLDKIPLDLYAFAVISVCGITVAVAEETGGFNWALTAFAALAIGTVWFGLALAFIISLAARIKYGKWWRNTIIYRAVILACRILKRFGAFCRRLFKQLPMFWKVGVAWAALSFVELVLIVGAGSYGAFVMWWFIEKLALTPLIILLVLNMRRLQTAGEEIAGGNLDYKVDLEHLILDFKAHGENLNSISEGLQRAVDERMKSERMKSELITNVSHDIKTPLTSIVNYVDLLKKGQGDPEKASEYIDVLDRQSARLKKLTEDLVEASKAATGNVSVNMERTDVNVLLSQTAGEYEDKLRELGIELVLSLSDKSPVINADGRLLWRVFENLMSNICKYAQEGTRVYLTSETSGGKAVISFKNISKYALNISADELMERFVRGDEARNTEGSGLGLSIATSLTSLQNGRFEIVIDGDLFKAVVTFELCE